MKANRRLLTMILASALTFGIANAKNDEYKHDNCYSYMRGLEAVQNEDNDEAHRQHQCHKQDDDQWVVECG